jgi:hypothetical protein
MSVANRSKPVEEDLHFGKVALNLGVVSQEEIEDVLGAREELRASGIEALTGDVMMDLRLITPRQCEQVFAEQDRLLRAAGLSGRVRAAPTIAALVAGMVPVLHHMPASGVLAWSGAILLGLALAGSSAWRWVGLGWITAVLAPTANTATIAGSGSLLRGWRMHISAVALGAALASFPLPAALHQAGSLFLIAAAVLALIRRAP